MLTPMTLILSSLLLVAIPSVTGDELLCGSSDLTEIETFINAGRLGTNYNITNLLAMDRKCIDETTCTMSNCDGNSLLEMFFVKDIMQHEYRYSAYPLYFSVTGRFEGTPTSDSSFGIIMLNGTVYENIVKFSSSGEFEGVSVKSNVFRKHRLCEEDAISYDNGDPVDISINDENITLTVEFKSGRDSVYYFYINAELFGVYLFDYDNAKAIEAIGFAVNSDATFIVSNVYLLNADGNDVKLPKYNSKGEAMEYEFEYEDEGNYNALIPILCAMLILSMVIHVACCCINYRNNKESHPKTTSLTV